MVVVLHMEWPGLFLGSALVRQGAYLVDFFFVLSSFVIAANYGDRLRDGFSLGRYMLLRLGRVWPLHLAVLGFLVAAKLASFALFPETYPGGEPSYGDRSLEKLFYAVFLLHGWQYDNGWHAVSWSISIEVFLYLFFALAWRFLGRWGLAVAVAGIAYGCAVRWGLAPGNSGVVRGLLGVSAGVVAWHVYRRYLSELAPGRGAATALEVLSGGGCQPASRDAAGRRGRVCSRGPGLRAGPRRNFALSCRPATRPPRHAVLLDLHDPRDLPQWSRGRI